MLEGLTDPVISRALMALYGDVAWQWTTEMLARQCGRSRSALVERFARAVGYGPIAYLCRRGRFPLSVDSSCALPLRHNSP